MYCTVHMEAGMLFPVDLGRFYGVGRAAGGSHYKGWVEVQTGWVEAIGEVQVWRWAGVQEWRWAGVYV